MPSFSSVSAMLSFYDIPLTVVHQYCSPLYSSSKIMVGIQFTIVSKGDIYLIMFLSHNKASID